MRAEDRTAPADRGPLGDHGRLRLTAGGRHPTGYDRRDMPCALIYDNDVMAAAAVAAAAGPDCPRHSRDAVVFGRAAAREMAALLDGASPSAPCWGAVGRRGPPPAGSYGRGRLAGRGYLARRGCRPAGVAHRRTAKAPAQDTVRRSLTVLRCRPVCPDVAGRPGSAVGPTSRPSPMGTGGASASRHLRDRNMCSLATQAACSSASGVPATPAACRAGQRRMDRRPRKPLAVVQSGVGEVECPECGARWVAGVEKRSPTVYCSKRCKVRA